MDDNLEEALLQVSGLSVHYRGRINQPALDSVSFALRKGDTLGVIGESGAGKTTMALAVSGLLDMDAAVVSGAVVFEDRDLLKLPERELCKVRGAGIGLILQDPRASLDPCMRVNRQVAEAIRTHNRLSRAESNRMACKQLAEVGLDEEVLESAPFAHQLSGGQAQRAMIAAALACSPRLLIADEPTSSLDVTTQAEIVRLLSDLQKQAGLAMIFISHDLALVSLVAESILVLRDGRVIEHGDRDQVLNRPAHSYTRSVIESWERSQISIGARLAPA